MTTLRQKAIDQNLEFDVKFENIGFIDNKFETNVNSPIINCDEHRIMQVLHAILANALKFTQKGKVETVVKMEERNESERYLNISVIDTGIGIPD